MIVVPTIESEAFIHHTLVQIRWPSGVRCAHCDSDQVGSLVVTMAESRSKREGAQPTVRRLWNCRGCHKQFTVKTGTVMEDSAMPLFKWVNATRILCDNPKYSTCKLATQLGITQKSAWLLRKRILLGQRISQWYRKRVQKRQDAPVNYFTLFMMWLQMLIMIKPQLTKAR